MTEEQINIRLAKLRALIFEHATTQTALPRPRKNPDSVRCLDRSGAQLEKSERF